MLCKSNGKGFAELPLVKPGILDSVEAVPFNIGVTWNDTFEKVMMAVVLAYFGGRTTEKATSLIKGKNA